MDAAMIAPTHMGIMASTGKQMIRSMTTAMGLRIIAPATAAVTTATQKVASTIGKRAAKP